MKKYEQIIFSSCYNYKDVQIIFFKTGLVVFYGISTFVGYLMPNPFLYK